MFAEIVNTYGQMILSTITTVIFGVLAICIRYFMARMANTEEKKAIAKSVVLFVEQCYKDLHGSDKLDAAMAVLGEQLAEHSIFVSDEEMRIMIEAAVAEFNAKVKLV